MYNRKLILSYLILSVLLIGSAVVLAYEVKHYLYERQSIEFKDPTAKQMEILEKFKEDEAQERKEILTTFNQTKAFRSLATPIPRPTPTPLPPPSPTPVVPANGYKLKYATGMYASLLRYDGETILAKEGDVIECEFGDFKILEVGTNPRPSVKVQDVKSGVVRIIYQDARKKPRKK